MHVLWTTLHVKDGYCFPDALEDGKLFYVVVFDGWRSEVVFAKYNYVEREFRGLDYDFTNKPIPEVTICRYAKVPIPKHERVIWATVFDNP